MTNSEDAELSKDTYCQFCRAGRYLFESIKLLNSQQEGTRLLTVEFEMYDSNDYYLVTIVRKSHVH